MFQHMVGTARSSAAFREAAGAELLAALDAEREVVYAIDRALLLHFVNHAWEDFARANDGEACLQDYGIGTSVKRAIPAVLCDFYESAFARVFDGGAPLDYLYECPSNAQHRSFRMRADRLTDDGYVIVSNHLVREVDFVCDEPRVPAVYTDGNGLVVQCAHCRRVRRVGTELWDWVPSCVSAPTEIISHGPCTSCFAQHYSR